MRQTFALVAGLLTLAALAAPADATLARRLSMDDLCASARDGAIVRVTVDTAESFLDESTKRIWTRYTCTIAESLHGSCDKTKPLTIHALGGEVDGVKQVVSGEPALTVKSAYSLFLRQEKQTQRWRVAGMNQGRFAEVTDAKTKQTTVANSYAGLTMVEVRDGSAVKATVAPKTLSYELGAFKTAVQNSLAALPPKKQE